MKERDCTFDIMKGIAMVLVIMSHTLPFEMTRPFAPFRSALFFVVSGYFAKEWLFKDFLIHGSKRLLIPYLFTCVLMFPLVLLGEYLFDYQTLLIALKSMALGSSSFEGTLFDINIGPLWFICALLWVRIFWSLMRPLKNDYVKGAIILLLAISALKLKNIVVLPWSLQPAFGALGFFFAGHIFRKYDVLNHLKGSFIPIICIISLFYGVMLGFTDINRGIYGGLYIIDVFASLGAFLVMYVIIDKISDKRSKIWCFLDFFGRYSLVAFCIHAMDQCLNVHWFPFKFWSFFTTEFELCCAVVLRVGFVAAGAYLVSKNKFLKEKVFFIR